MSDGTVIFPERRNAKKHSPRYPQERQPSPPNFTHRMPSLFLYLGVMLVCPSSGVCFSIFRLTRSSFIRSFLDHQSMPNKYRMTPAAHELLAFTVLDELSWLSHVSAQVLLFHSVLCCHGLGSKQLVHTKVLVALTIFDLIYGTLGRQLNVSSPHHPACHRAFAQSSSIPTAFGNPPE